ncbi:hypothetical protein LXL04_010258 [Taraxacum kok-saghyz]
MDNQKEIFSSEEHVAKAKPQKNKSPQKLTKVDKKKAIHENQKLKNDVDLDDNDLLNKIIGSDGKSTDEDDSQDNSEYISVDVDLLHELLDCPLCKEIAKKVKAIKYCLHRFCGECIDKWLENGNTECPTCKTDFVSQKALVRDHNRDKLVAVCFPDREEHEAQDEDTQLMSDKSLESLDKKPEDGDTSTPFVPSEEMLDRVSKQVADRISKYKRKHQQLPAIDEKKES